MYRKDNKLYYDWSDYVKDMKSIDQLNFDHVIGIYRGSLLMASHISNVRDVPMSIVGFQTRDGQDKKPYWIHNAQEKDYSKDLFPEIRSGIQWEEGSKVLIVDDIYDTGYTMQKVIEFVKEERIRPSAMPTVLTYCLFGKDVPEEINLVYSNLHEGDWIVFPWEV